jgi:hypothetical protein
METITKKPLTLTPQQVDDMIHCLIQAGNIVDNCKDDLLRIRPWCGLNSAILYMDKVLKPLLEAK